MYCKMYVETASEDHISINWYLNKRKYILQLSEIMERQEYYFKSLSSFPEGCSCVVLSVMTIT